MDPDSSCSTAAKLVAPAQMQRRHVRIGDRIDAGELERAQEPADQQGDGNQEPRRRTEKKAGMPTKTEDNMAFAISTRRKPKR